MISAPQPLKKHITKLRRPRRLQRVTIFNGLPSKVSLLSWADLLSTSTTMRKVDKKLRSGGWSLLRELLHSPGLVFYLLYGPRTWMNGATQMLLLKCSFYHK